MAECPICATPYQEGSSKTCSHCGFDLTPYPQTLGQIPTAYLEKEESQLESVRQMWVKLQNEAQKQKQIIAQLEKLNQTQARQFQQAEKTTQELKNQIQELKRRQQQYVQAQETFKRQITQLNKEKQTKNEQLTDLTQENRQLKEENRTQKQQLIDLRGKNEQLREENYSLLKQKLAEATNIINNRSQETAKYFTEDLGNGVTLDMVYIPAGSFMMGTDDAEIARLCKEYAISKNWFKNEVPQHRVTLNAFYMAKYPITQAQYQAIMGSNPSHFSNAKNAPLSKGGWGDYPVEEVSWDMAQQFCQKLSQKTGKKYKLPSEAQWEYACRAGSTTKYYFGDDDNQLGDYAWYDDNSNCQTHAVGEKKPNQWGLYDMLGNVPEWCEDDYADKYKNTPRDGTSYINPSMKCKCLRGDIFLDSIFVFRCAFRESDDPSKNDLIGFRVACVVSNTT